MAPLHASLSLWTWQWDPTVLLGTLALGGGYAWLIRGRGRVAAWSPLARVSFAGGLLALFLALESPIDVGGDKYLFSLHMLQHLLLAMVVPPLLLLGLPEEWRAFTRIRIPSTVTFSMCPYRDTWVISQNASAALKYMSGVGAEPSPPRLGPSSEANVMWPESPRLTVASLRYGVTRLTSASKTISRVSILGFNPSGTVAMIAPQERRSFSRTSTVRAGSGRRV